MATIALIAHDEKKPALAAWAERHRSILSQHSLVCTGTTGKIVLERVPDLTVRRVRSGPLGGDQQIGAMIVEGSIDALIFLADPLTAMPHDVDVKALLRIALVYDIPCAFNARSADLLMLSGFLDADGVV